MQAEGLRVMPSTPQSSAVPKRALNVSDSVNGMNRETSRNTPPTPTITITDCISIAMLRLRATRCRISILSSAPPASAIMAMARVLTGASRLDRLVVDQVQDVRTAHDAGKDVARQVRQADHLEQLARERAGEQQEAERRDRAEVAFLELGRELGGPPEQAEDDGEGHRLDHARLCVLGRRRAVAAHDSSPSG